MQRSLKAIIGIGNPGAKYENTLHNAGCWFVKQLATQPLIKHNKLAASFADYANGKLKLFCSTSFMNNSGNSVRAIVDYFDLELDQILIVHDELDLPEGTSRYKAGGGLGGHNGLKSIAQHLKTQDFLRLRIGIGHPGSKDKVTPFVLAPPSKQAKTLIEDSIAKAILSIDALVAGDLQLAMRQLHN